MEVSTDGSAVKNVPANAGDTGDMGSIPGSGRSPGVGNGNPLQDSCLGNSMDRRAWRATVHGVTESDMTEHMWNIAKIFLNVVQNSTLNLIRYCFDIRYYLDNI